MLRTRLTRAVAIIFVSMAATNRLAAEKPPMRDFIGLCVHTVQFKPDLYAPVTRVVRDYHSLEWDVGKDTDFTPQFPFARNRVDWKELYGTWGKAGYDIDVSIMFNHTKPKDWKDLPRDAHAYGLAFAKYFGPASAQKLVTSVEIGNEPGHYDDATYRDLFANMARGVREGDPKLRILTCAAIAGQSTKYYRSLDSFKGLENLYDIINVHTYAEVEGWPTWKRSYPEDGRIKYLKDVNSALAWRDHNAPGKEIWITEFGWDASTRPAPAEGDFKKWIGSSETQQAQYLVRSFLVFSEMDVQRAYIYFFNDADEPHVHGSSGLTRNFKPKPAYYAVAHLLKTLGDYRFSKVIEKKADDVYVYEYQHVSNPKQRIWAAWSPTGSNRQTEVLLPAPAGKITHAERTPVAPDKVESVDWKMDGKNLRTTLAEFPTFFTWQAE